VLGGFVRLAHPFPSLLDGLVVAGVSLIAGADAGPAAVLGVSMTALQVSIGSLNDIVDAPRDRVAKPGKPIPLGLVSRKAASVVAVASAGAGLAPGWLSGTAGPAVGLLGVVVLGIGYGYDLAFKGTAWSWLPFAVGIPLLPVYGWVGATGGLPSSFGVLVPVAIIAGAGLAIANARADEARDRAAGTVSVATRLGGRLSWRVDAVLLVTVVGAAIVTLLAGDAGSVAIAGATGAAAVIAAGLVVGRSDDADRRERAWEMQAVGVALLAAAWLSGVPLAG
jgi:4-hydroxybenzoate polyprenyltransferase